MAKHAGRHAARRNTWVGRIAVMLVVALSGWLLVTNLRVNSTASVPNDTAELIEQRVNQVQGLQDDVQKLSAQISTLTGITASNGSGSSDGNEGGGSDATDTDDPGAGTTLPAIEGPGLAVTLDDSPLWEQAVDGSGSADDIDSYVIHQQDIEAVINALWAGGARAMMFEDQRILFNSAVLCAGNVVSLHGKRYSPPFTITAIGNVDDLTAALDDSKQIKIYKEYVSAFGLGWKVEKRKKLEYPETAALLQPLKYATVPADAKRNSQEDR